MLRLLRKKMRGPAATVDDRQRPASLCAAPAMQKLHPVHRVLHYGSIYTPVSTVNMCYASVYGCLLVLEMVYLCTALNLLQNGGTILMIELCFGVFGLCT